MSQPIWYDSSEADAPVLNNVAGSLLDVLRACLISGFNEKTVTSIAVADEVATATCTGHGFLGTYGKLVQISGVTEPLLNGNKQPGGVLTDSFTFPAPGVADGTYTGTILARRAPLGWTEPYTGTDVAMFARSSVEATTMLLRVDDSGTSVARVIQVETATGVDAYTGPSPTEGQFAGGGYWQKFNSADSNRWFLAGDDRAFWLGTGTSSSPVTFVYYFFGDGVPYYAGDAYFSVIAFQTTTFWNPSPTFPMRTSAPYTTEPSGSTGVYTSRGQSLGSAESEVSAVGGPNTGSQLYGSYNLQAASAGSVALVGNLHILGASKLVRGEVPGLYTPMAAVPFTSLDPISGADGRRYLPVRFNSSGSDGQICIQISGEWYSV